MKHLFTLALLLISVVAFAQKVTPDNHIVVIGQASIDVPADQVRFNVNLISSDSSSIDKVYQEHQEQENKMVKLLKELQIPASDIRYYR